MKESKLYWIQCRLKLSVHKYSESAWLKRTRFLPSIMTLYCYLACFPLRGCRHPVKVKFPPQAVRIRRRTLRKLRCRSKFSHTRNNVVIIILANLLALLTNLSPEGGSVLNKAIWRKFGCVNLYVSTNFYDFRTLTSPNDKYCLLERLEKNKTFLR